MADSIRATPQNPTLGAIAAALRRAQQFTGQYQVDPRVPLLGGTGLDELLSLPGAASLMEDVSYNGPRALIRGGNVATGGIGTFRPDPRVADVADVAMNVTPLGMVAGKAATKGAMAAGRAGERLAERVVPQVMEQGGFGAQALQALGSGTTSNVIKPKGGNWLAGSVEEAVKPMRQTVREPEFMRRIAQDEVRGLAPEGVLEATHNQNSRAEAVNRWLENKLAKYIRNEMGTPEDSVRALAERGVLHYELPGLDTYNMDAVGRARQAAGFPAEGMATTQLGREWETAADRAIYPSEAGYLTRTKEVETNPWLLKVPPETVVHEIGPRSAEFNQLGFGHLVDELKFSMDPNSDLPQRLRFDPKDIDKLTVPQAVERVAKINAWRAEQAAQAEKAGMMANLQATPRMADDSFELSFVDKPGGAWVDIPETVDDKGMKLCNSIGKAGGWCTQADWAAKSYGSGENRLTALVDTEGRPHAQAKITRKVDEADAFDSILQTLTPEQEAAYMRFAETLDGPAEVEDVIEWMMDEAPEAFANFQRMLDVKPSDPPSITELKPVGNSFSSERAQEYAKRDPEYFRKIENSVLKFLNSGEWGNVADLHHYGIVDLQRDPVMLLSYLRDITGGDSRTAQAVFNAAVDANPETPRFMTTRQLRAFVEPFKPIDDAPQGFAGGGIVKGAVKSIGEMVEKYLAKEAPQAAPKEQKMLMGVYRGYAGEAPGETVYHAGAEFKEPRPGLFTTPERAAAEQFQRFTGAPRLHTLEAKPRRTGTEEDVYAMARRLGIYNPGVPAGQYLEQGENAIFPEAAMMVEELRNQGLDSLRLADGISKKPSLVALDPTVVRPAQEVFATPQRRIAEYYAQKRAAQTGAEPHLEMLLVDPFAGGQYGHAIPIDRLNRDINYTRARKLKPEDVQDRTKLYAGGGAVSAPTASAYDPDEIDTIVSQLKEEFHA